MGFDDALSKVAPCSRPRRRWCRQSVAQSVRRVLVVDPPAVKIGPRLLGGALHGKADVLQHRHGDFELAELELQRVVGLGIEVELPTERRRDSIGQRESHAKTESSL